MSVSARLASFVARLGLIAHTAVLVLRWRTIYDMGFGHPPLINLYESLLFFAWSIMILYLAVEWHIKNKSLGAFVVPIAFLVMAYASIAPGISSQIQPLIPALQSNWLTTHVVTCFMGYAAFTVAFGCGLLYLWKSRKEDKETENTVGLTQRLPSLSLLDTLIYQSAALGFVFLVIGIMTGSVRAHYAWGCLLELGSQRNIVSYYVACLRDLTACPLCPWMAR